MTTKKTPDDIRNEANAKFWAERHREVESLLTDASLVKKAISNIDEEAKRWLALTGRPFLGVPSFEKAMLGAHADRRDAEQDLRPKIEKELEPDVSIGRKFRAGRKPGTVSPIRKAIARTLGKDPKLKNDAMWKMLSAKPPKGWTFCDNRVGKYIEGPKGGQGMTYERFCNIAAEERRAIKT